MRCEACNYPLWNLKARACPECGRAFKPSEREFVPNSVRFCCPSCDQPYYGTGARGHLVPASFDCVRCGTAVAMDEMVLRPTAGLVEEETRVESMPWLERKRIGRLRAWFRMIGRAMILPASIIRNAPPERAHGQAWWFALVTIVIVMLSGAGLVLYGAALVSLVSRGGDTLDFLAVGSIMTGVGVGGMLLIVVLWGLVAHLALRLSGGAAYGLGRTYQAICYSVGACVTMAVPCVGVYPLAFVGLLWWMVSAILMLMVGQRVHPGRAVFAIMVFPALAGLVVSVGGAGLMMHGLSRAQAIAKQSAGTVSQKTECTIMVDALLAHRDEHGAWPAHAFAMVPGDMVTAWDFTSNESGTAAALVQLGDTTLDVAAGMTPGARRELIDALVAAQPPGAVAHRVGDFVFTYHGVDPAPADGGLWLVVMSPDPAAGGAPSINGAIVAGRADGSVDSIDEAAFAAALIEQNELRAAHGLDPIPDPATVAGPG